MPIQSDGAQSSSKGPSPSFDEESTPLLEPHKPHATGRLSAYLVAARSSMTASTGFLADGYDLFVVDVVVQILFHLDPDHMRPHDKSFAVSLTFVGVILGQMISGIACDILDPRSVSLMTALLQFVGCVTAACCTSMNHFGIAYQLGICRFVMGLGVGGEFPVSQVLSQDAGAAEGAGAGAGEPAVLTRNQRVVLNSCFFNVGMMVAPALFMILLAGSISLESVWRAAVACGTVPSMIAMVLRLKLRRQQRPARPVGGAAGALETGVVATCRRVSTQWWLLTGCSVLWLLHNMVFFSLGSFKSYMNEKMFGASWTDRREKIQHDSTFVFFTSVASFACAAMLLFIVDRFKHFNLIVLFFAGVAVVFWVIGILLMTDSGPHWFLLVLMYFLCFAGVGMGSMMYLVSGISFPREVRATCFSISASASKVGALIGTAIFPVLEHVIGLGWMMCLFGLVCALGAAIAAIFAPEGEGLSLCLGRGARHEKC